jgi:hypothetical protein
MKLLKQMTIALTLSALIAPALVQACPDYKTSRHWGCTGKGCQSCKSAKPQVANKQLNQVAKNGGKPTKPTTPDSVKRTEPKSKVATQR